jgi:hypothetical protein
VLVIGTIAFDPGYVELDSGCGANVAAGAGFAAATGTGAVSTSTAAGTDAGPTPVGGGSGWRVRSVKCDDFTQRLTPQV